MSSVLQTITSSLYLISIELTSNVNVVKTTLKSTAPKFDPYCSIVQTQFIFHLRTILIKHAEGLGALRFFFKKYTY